MSPPGKLRPYLEASYLPPGLPERPLLLAQSLVPSPPNLGDLVLAPESAPCFSSDSAFFLTPGSPTGAGKYPPKLGPPLAAMPSPSQLSRQFLSCTEGKRLSEVRNLGSVRCEPRAGTCCWGKA
jgi:hypothetical protein